MHELDHILCLICHLCYDGSKIYLLNIYMLFFSPGIVIALYPTFL